MREIKNFSFSKMLVKYIGVTGEGENNREVKLLKIYIYEYLIIAKLGKW